MFFKKIHLKGKSVSPLIATILLIVVSVAIITIVLYWGKGFTQESIASTEVFKESSLSHFVYFDKIIDHKVFIKNTHLTEDLEIIKYKIISSRDEHNFKNINEYITLVDPILISRSNTNFLELPCLVDSSFILEVLTSKNEYISIPVNIRNYYKYSYLDCLLLLDFDSTDGVLKDNMVGKNIDFVYRFNGFISDNWKPRTGGVIDSQYQINNFGAYIVNANIKDNRTYFLQIISDDYSNLESVYSTQTSIYWNLVATSNFDKILFKTNSSYTGGGIVLKTNGEFIVKDIILTEIRDDVIFKDIFIKKTGSIYSAEFNGLTSYIDTGSNFIGNKEITVCSWLKPNNWEGWSGNVSFLVSNGYSDGFGTIIRSTSNNSVVFFGSISAISNLNTIIVNSWNYICVTKDFDGIINFYKGNVNLNPILSGENISSGSSIYGNTNVIIGSRSKGSLFFDGFIGQLKIFEGILTQEEINSIYFKKRNLFR